MEAVAQRLVTEEQKGVSPRQTLVEEEPMTRDENSSRPDAELARLAADGDAAAFDEI